MTDMVYDFYDTSAILAHDSIESLFNGEGVDYVSHFVLSELEDIKNNSNKDEKIKARARKASRLFLTKPESFVCETFSTKEYEKVFKKYSFLPRNIDGHILAEAIMLNERKDTQVVFWTADVNLYLFSQKVLSYQRIVLENEIAKEEWCGWAKYYPNEKEMSLLYSDPKVNVLNAEINEYCEIYEDKELKDILHWDGTQYQHLEYKPVTSAVGQKWKPLNTEQKMLFDLLQNDNIPIKLALGNFGSGKTALMLTHALDMVQKGKMDKIVFIRNNSEVRDVTPLGALPGEESDKLRWLLSPIIDHVGLFTFEDMIEQNIIEATHLGFVRGRDFKRCILFADESENLTVHQVQLLIGRIGKESMLFMAGDLRQTDRPIFDTNSGIRKMIERLKGEKLFGMVKLIKSERSEVCRLADNLD